MTDCCRVAYCKGNALAGSPLCAHHLEILPPDFMRCLVAAYDPRCFSGAWWIAVEGAVTELEMTERTITPAQVRVRRLKALAQAEGLDSDLPF